jgi:hypothetical protein
MASVWFVCSPSRKQSPTRVGAPSRNRRSISAVRLRPQGRKLMRSDCVRFSCRHLLDIASTRPPRAKE